MVTERYPSEKSVPDVEQKLVDLGRDLERFLFLAVDSLAPVSLASLEVPEAAARPTAHDLLMGACGLAAARHTNARREKPAQAYSYPPGLGRIKNHAIDVLDKEGQINPTLAYWLDLFDHLVTVRPQTYEVVRSPQPELEGPFAVLGLPESLSNPPGIAETFLANAPTSIEAVTGLAQYWVATGAHPALGDRIVEELKKAYFWPDDQWDAPSAEQILKGLPQLEGGRKADLSPKQFWPHWGNASALGLRKLNRLREFGCTAFEQGSSRRRSLEELDRPTLLLNFTYRLSRDLRLILFNAEPTLENLRLFEPVILGFTRHVEAEEIYLPWGDDVSQAIDHNKTPIGEGYLDLALRTLCSSKENLEENLWGVSIRRTARALQPYAFLITDPVRASGGKRLDTIHFQEAVRHHLATKLLAVIAAQNGQIALIPAKVWFAEAISQSFTSTDPGFTPSRASRALAEMINLTYDLAENRTYFEGGSKRLEAGQAVSDSIFALSDVFSAIGRMVLMVNLYSLLHFYNLLPRVRVYPPKGENGNAFRAIETLYRHLKARHQTRFSFLS